MGGRLAAASGVIAGGREWSEQLQTRTRGKVMAERWEYKQLLLGTMSDYNGYVVLAEDGRFGQHEPLQTRLTALSQEGWDIGDVIPGTPHMGVLAFPTLLLRKIARTGRDEAEGYA
jgi:hypothetical protein